MSASTNESLPGGLCNRTLDTIVERNNMVEFGAPYLTLHSAMSPDPVGMVRVFGPGPETTGPVEKVVYVALAVPAIGLDSHMVFAFTQGDSPVPHFTLDSVHGQGTYAFHLDLIQRAELATHLTYLDWSHSPLSPTYDDVETWEGLGGTTLGPRQFAMMSPWMLVHRADEATFRKMDGPVGAYLDQWSALVAAEVPAEVLADVADTDLAARDQRNRANIFSPDVDPIWGQVAQLLNPETMEVMRGQLLNNVMPTELPAQVNA
ncbi:hypothetical protein [Nocardioides sp.]|uniref:hypothetical protein n=1 Tax=Nocardioides sp. TaxID=35761 RepID=UPI003563D42F